MDKIFILRFIGKLFCKNSREINNKNCIKPIYTFTCDIYGKEKTGEKRR